MMAITYGRDEQLRVLQALNSILDYAKTSAEDIGERPLVQAIEDAKSIARFTERRLRH